MGPPVGGYVVTLVGGSVVKKDVDGEIDQAKLAQVAQILGIPESQVPENIQSIYVFRSPDDGGVAAGGSGGGGSSGGGTGGGGGGGGGSGHGHGT